MTAEGLSIEGLGTSIGKGKAEQVYYYALTHLMHPSDQFLDARRALIASANTLYGATEAAAVSAAWDAVGVVEPTQIPANSGVRLMTDADVVSGATYLVYVDVNGGIYVQGSTNTTGPINSYPATQTRPAVYFDPTKNDGFTGSDRQREGEGDRLWIRGRHDGNRCIGDSENGIGSISRRA